MVSTVYLCLNYFLSVSVLVFPCHRLQTHFILYVTLVDPVSLLNVCYFVFIGFGFRFRHPPLCISLSLCPYLCQYLCT